MKTLFASAAMAAVLAAPVYAETWEPDPAHTNIEVTWNHVGFSFLSATFREFEGSLEFEEGDIANARADFSVMVSSVDTGVPDLDGHLQGADFFNAAENPVIQFVSTSVEQTGDMTVEATGDLTMAGQTNPVTFEITVHALGEHPVGQFFEFYQGTWLGMTATATINRSDWGISAMIPVGSDEIQIEINTEMKAGGIDS